MEYSKSKSTWKVMTTYEVRLLGIKPRSDKVEKIEMIRGMHHFGKFDDGKK